MNLTGALPGAVDLGYRRVLRPVLFRSSGGDPERVHERTLAAIEGVGTRPRLRSTLARLSDGPRRPVTVAGVSFPALVGLAAGMDKNGVGVRSWAALGFGHVELGTVTAVSQPGNPAPRLFRLRSSGALVNRMGFNNEGAMLLAARLDAAGVRRGNGAVGLPLGISIGKNKVTPLADATLDYLAAFGALATYADYVAVNVSSPNTPGLRSLQEGDAFRELVEALVGAARDLDPERPVPIFVKVAPDLTEDALEELLAVCVAAGVSGLVATNTTLSRAGVRPADQARAAEAGGLSGAPLTVRAREVVRFLTSRTDLPVIGVGGIMTVDDGRAMLDAGAALLQVYTGYVYGGPGLVRGLNALNAGDRTEPPTLGEKHA